MAIKYSNEFKESIVSLSQTGRSANSLAKEYNVSVSTVTKWIKQADPNNTKVLSSNECALIKENKRLKEETIGALEVYSNTIKVPTQKHAKFVTVYVEF